MMSHCGRFIKHIGWQNHWGWLSMICHCDCGEYVLIPLGYQMLGDRKNKGYIGHPPLCDML